MQLLANKSTIYIVASHTKSYDPKGLTEKQQQLQFEEHNDIVWTKHFNSTTMTFQKSSNKYS